jgi:hypothetical protein
MGLVKLGENMPRIYLFSEIEQDSPRAGTIAFERVPGFASWIHLDRSRSEEFRLFVGLAPAQYIINMPQFE